MPDGTGERRWWWVLLLGIVAAGLLSRLSHTGFRVIDKYLGDALYAAMVYTLFRLTGRIRRVALWAAAAMLAIELFQLTGVPARLLRSEHLAVRACARLLGTEFSVLDLLAYAVGIGGIAVLDCAKLPGLRPLSGPPAEFVIRPQPNAAPPAAKSSAGAPVGSAASSGRRGWFRTPRCSCSSSDPPGSRC